MAAGRRPVGCSRPEHRASRSAAHHIDRCRAGHALGDAGPEHLAAAGRAVADDPVRLVDLQSLGRGLGNDPAGDHADRLVLAQAFGTKSRRCAVIRAETVVGDVSGLPDHNFGPASLGWWGVIGFMLIEGMGFVLAIGVYFYLLPYERTWPPNQPPPSLLWGTAF